MCPPGAGGLASRPNFHYQGLWHLTEGTTGLPYLVGRAPENNLPMVSDFPEKESTRPGATAAQAAGPPPPAEAHRLLDTARAAEQACRTRRQADDGQTYHGRLVNAGLCWTPGCRWSGATCRRPCPLG